MASIPSQMPFRRYLGLNVKEFCGNGFIDNSHNHCAHFVAHALGLSVGYTCRAHMGGKDFGASIRVHELFSHCREVGHWADKPENLDACLIFITKPDHINVAKKTMINHPRKHVGIYHNGLVTHYSNTMDYVTLQPVSQFENHYPEPFNGLFYGRVLMAL